MEENTYRRRILVAAAGLSPQVVTETMYALATGEAPAFVPTEVHLVTTQEGAERAKLSLLGETPGWFARCCEEYGLRGVGFPESNIHVLEGRDGKGLSDIRTAEDNQAAADGITELIRELTLDPEAALHVSIAGGRKTMGFYLGYALSLYGRAQDRLSHVLVSAPFESHPEFYYPTKERRVIYTAPPDSRPLDTRTARVTLAEIPFVRLRHGLPEALLAGRARFGEAVAAAQQMLGPPELALVGMRGVKAGGVEIRMAPAELAFYWWMARRRRRGEGGVECPSEGAPEAGHAAEYLREYSWLMGEMGADERTRRALAGGMEKGFFLEKKARVNGALKRALGAGAEAYLIWGEGRRPGTRFGLRLEASRIQLREEEA